MDAQICIFPLLLFFYRPPRAKDKDRECDILNPVALMFNEKEGKLYIGENGRITVKQGINTQNSDSLAVPLPYMCMCSLA